VIGGKLNTNVALGLAHLALSLGLEGGYARPFETPVVASLLGLDVADDAAAPEAVIEFGKRSVADRTRVTMALAAARMEQSVGYRFHTWDDDDRAYYAVLLALGYEPTATEQAKLDAKGDDDE
jgi:hypothetical protein